MVYIDKRQRASLLPAWILCKAASLDKSLIYLELQLGVIIILRAAFQ